MRSIFFKITSNTSGFSLIELVVVLGILGIVAAGTSAHLLNTHREQTRLGSKTNMMQTEGLIAKAFSIKNAATARTCKQSLQLVGAFSKTGDSDVQIDLGDAVLKAQAKIAGMNQFTINRLYLGDTLDLGPQRPNYYLANLYMTAEIGPMDRLFKTKPRNIATIVVRIDPGTNALVDCNVSTTAMNDNDVCDGMYGMEWNGTRCEQKLNLDPDFNLQICPNGTHNISGICVPTPSGCGPGQIADGFDLGIVQACATPPLNPAFGVPTLSVPAPVQGVPDQIPARSVASVDPLVPVTQTPIPPQSTPLPTSAACQVNGATMDSANYALCEADPVCKQMMIDSGVTSNNCGTTQTVSYSTPSPTATPSNAPPTDLSCQCNTARVANGDYCSYCSSNINIGYKFVNYAYAVNRCVSGNLVPVPTASSAFDPIDECSGGYAPTYFDGSRYRQFEGYDLR